MSYSIDKKLVASRFKLMVDDKPKEFAYVTGLSLSAVYNYVKGDRVPATDVLYKVARSLDKSIDWILGLED